MDREAGKSICGACGHASATGTRFCTRCGAALEVAVSPVEQAVPVEPPRPDPAPPSTPAAAAPPTRWALDTPPANEPWWRNPIVVVMAIVSILFGGGVASWRLFISSGAETVSVVRALPSAEQTGAPSPPTATTQADDVATPVRAIGRLLEESASGRAAALNRHDYGAALRNRRRLLAQLDQISVPAQPSQLTDAVAMLRTALVASAQADAGHLACGCDAELAADVTASQRKRRFAMLFDPYARRYLGGPVDPNQI